MFHTYLHRAASDSDQQWSLQRRTSARDCALNVLVCKTTTPGISSKYIPQVVLGVREE